MKVLYDKDTRLPGWSFAPTQGATKDAEGDGITFTIDAWKEGIDMWPRLVYSGPGIDLSGYTKIVFEVENTAPEGQPITVAAKSVPEDNAGLAGQLPARSVGQVILDISDGAPVDASNVREMFCYLYQPGGKVTYVLKKIMAMKNPDFVSKRAAMGRQIEEARRELEDLKAAVTDGQDAIKSIQEIQAQVDSLTKEYDRRAPGYAVGVQKTLLTAQSDIARTGMDLRKADLLLWNSPLGVAIREGTLPSPADHALTSVKDTICLNQYKAICVNVSAGAKAQAVRFKLDQSTNGPFTLRPTLMVKARDGSMVADAIGLDTSKLQLDVPAYQTQQVIVWVNAKKPGLKAGSHRAALEISGTAGSKTIPIDIDIADVRLASKLPISTSNWAYFYMGSTKVTDGLEKQTVANLRDYGMNTWNMDYTQVPMPVIGADGKYAGLHPDTLKRLTQLLDLLRGVPDEEFVLWFGMQREQMRTSLARPGVLEGYLKDLHRLLDRYKIPLDKRYIMFWDEPRLPELRETVEWMKRTRAIDPTFKFYDNGTAIPTDPREFEAFVGMTDRWFPNWDQLYVARPEEAKKIDALDIPRMGFYRCLMSRNNRGVNIYEYYRLMGWYAMQHGFETLAFWVHNVGVEDVWDGTTGSSSGGIVVYSKDGKLLTSRRWELFREGVDDYKLAQAAFGTKGAISGKKIPQLRQICEDVAAHPNDPTRADQARLKLIALAQKRPAIKKQ